MSEKFTRPTTERLRHANGSAEHVVLDDTDAAGNKLSVVTTRISDWLLDRLRRRSKPDVSADQYNCGLRLYQDWYHSHPHSSGTVDYARTIVDGGYSGLTESERVTASKQRFEHAMRSLCRQHRTILHACLIEEQSLESYGASVYRCARARDARLAALCVLRDALDALVDHYHGSKRSGGEVRASHVAGYRPAGLAGG